MSTAPEEHQHQTTFRHVSKSALIIANPVARRGRPNVERVVQKLIANYRAAGWSTTHRYTERSGARERHIVEQLGATADAIAVAGGDGTIRETVLGMTNEQRARIPIGFVPMGNANVLAREVGIAWDDEDEAIQQIMAGHTTRLDIGTIDGKPAFLLMLDVGYFAQVVHTVTRIRSRRSTNWLYALGGDLLYGIAGAAHLLPFGAARVDISVDGHRTLTTASIAIANASTFAKNGSLCPEATLTSGQLHYNALRNRQTLLYSLAAIRGKPSLSASQLGSGKQFLLEAVSKPFVAQIDGDPLPGGPLNALRVEVLPSYYSLITPDPTQLRRHAGSKL